MKCMFWLLQLALCHIHVYEQWKTVWNMYLEKKPSHPLIDSIRTLHLFEVDYNLLLKWHSSLGFMPKLEKHDCILDSQGGGRAGQSAIDLACKKVLVIYDYVFITRINAIDVSIDVTDALTTWWRPAKTSPVTNMGQIWHSYIWPHNNNSAIC